MYKKWLLVGYMPKKKCATGTILGIVSAAVAAGGTVASTVSANKTRHQQQDNFEKELSWAEHMNTVNNIFNASQAQISRDFNADEAELNRQFQQSEAQKQRDWYEEYNAPSAQVKRYMDAGLNPATLGGNTSYSPMYSVPSGDNASSNPASASGYSMPSLPNLQPTDYNGVADVINQGLQGMKTLAETKNIEEDSQTKFTFNKYADEIYDSGVNLTKSEIRKNYAAVKECMSNIDLIRQNILESKAKITMLDANTENVRSQTREQNIKNLYADDLYAGMVDNMVASKIFTYQQSDCLLKRTIAEVAKYRADTSAAYAQKAYLESLEKLTDKERKQVEAYTRLLDTTNQQQAWDLLVHRHYDIPLMEWQLKGAAEDVDTKVFNNSFLGRGLNVIKESTAMLAAVLALALNARRGGKFPTGNYQYNPASGNISSTKDLLSY